MKRPNDPSEGVTSLYQPGNCLLRKRKIQTPTQADEPARAFSDTAVCLGLHCVKAFYTQST